ncbi:MAG: hypothetical protein GF401_08670 [Chitinivibrionales bacterium]|nr:hypothetical protein [Chitinivibrionales bacterium]
MKFPLPANPQGFMLLLYASINGNQYIDRGPSPGDSAQGTITVTSPEHRNHLRRFR